MTDQNNPDIILRGIRRDLHEHCIRLAHEFERDCADKVAGDFALYCADPKSPPSCTIHWTKSGAIVVRARPGWRFAP